MSYIYIVHWFFNERNVFEADEYREQTKLFADLQSALDGKKEIIRQLEYDFTSEEDWRQLNITVSRIASGDDLTAEEILNQHSEVIKPKVTTKFLSRSYEGDVFV